MSLSKATPNGSPGVDTLTRLADAIREKYHGVWDFTPAEDGFGHTDETGDSHIAHVFRVPPGQGAGVREVPRTGRRRSASSARRMRQILQRGL